MDHDNLAIWFRSGLIHEVVEQFHWLGSVGCLHDCQVLPFMQLQGYVHGWLIRRKWRKIVKQYINSPMADLGKKRNQVWEECCVTEGWCDMWWCMVCVWVCYEKGVCASDGVWCDIVCDGWFMILYCVQLIWKFAASEEDYVSQLTVLNEEYKQHLEMAAISRKPLLSLEQFNTLFRNRYDYLHYLMRGVA